MKSISRRALLLRLLLVAVLGSGVLVRAGFIRGQHGQQNEALFAALQSDTSYNPPNPALVRRLLKEGADPNARISTTAPIPAALFWTAPREVAAIWFDVRVRRRSDETALTAATEQGDYGGADDTAAALVTLLLNRGADVNGRNGSGSTALMSACALGEDKTVALLLSRGADANLQDDSGHTALMAVPHDSTARLLLAHGAKVNLRDKDGKTALAHAVTQKSEAPADTALLQVLKSAGATL